MLVAAEKLVNNFLNKALACFHFLTCYYISLLSFFPFTFTFHRSYSLCRKKHRRYQFLLAFPRAYIKRIGMIKGHFVKSIMF